MMFGLAFFLIAALVPLVLGPVLAKRFTSWTRWRVIVIAAAPIPAVATLVVFLIVAASLANSQNDEGILVTALSAVPGVVAASILYVLSLGLAAIVVFVARRGQGSSGAGINEIFE
jgi:hypothetical protein